jgi:plastocyanin
VTAQGDEPFDRGARIHGLDRKTGDRTMRRGLNLLAVVAISVALFAACGSSKSSGSSASSGNTVKMTAKDFSYSPTAVSTKQGKVTFAVQNRGTVEHNLTVEGLKINKDVKAGESASVTVDAKPGTYAFHCEYHPTKMKGTITIGS